MTTIFYDDWRDVPESTWRWLNFSPPEIAVRPVTLARKNYLFTGFDAGGNQPRSPIP